MRSSFTGALAALLILLQAPTLFGDAQEFDFTDPKGVNSVSFILDSEVEPIVGFAGGVSGKISFDPKKPKALTGRLVIDARSIRLQNERMQREVLGPEWLDAENNPQITFEVKKVKTAKKDRKKKGTLNYTLVGEFTIKGVTKKVTVKASASHLPGRLRRRFPGKGDGDLLVLRAQFTISRKDFKIGRRMLGVADAMEIRVAIVGGCEKRGSASN